MKSFKNPFTEFSVTQSENYGCIRYEMRRQHPYFKRYFSPNGFPNNRPLIMGTISNAQKLKTTKLITMVILRGNLGFIPSAAFKSSSRPFVLHSWKTAA
ncbi:hypothetical protein CEXT_740261 [Caerostris extrusa]|uniref:Uncharacterized protein n=1 Tax=Caerostris extrusa TaxID=172846 RepID=A0AAV4RK66_CAEEX|nr:hypothetical protein CEXT_740261 [Caerostris extrusa]